MASYQTLMRQQSRQRLNELDELIQRLAASPIVPTEETESHLEKKEEHDVSAVKLPLPHPSLSVPVPEPRLQAWTVSPQVPGPISAPQHDDPPPLALPLESDTAARVHDKVLPPIINPLPAVQAKSTAPFPYAMVFGQNSQPAPIPTALSGPVPPPLDKVDARPGKASAPPPAPIPWVLLPILILNILFNLLTYLLGPIGSWLRRPAGRQVMGWLGILMILAAIGWGVADWYGFDWIR